MRGEQSFRDSAYSKNDRKSSRQRLQEEYYHSNSPALPQNTKKALLSDVCLRGHFEPLLKAVSASADRYPACQRICGERNPKDRPIRGGKKQKEMKHLTLEFSYLFLKQARLWF